MKNYLAVHMTVESLKIKKKKKNVSQNSDVDDDVS